ncbi:4257_t:CDS:2 [Ambispora gerdemannii]|uniref:4257_t:CDS:1 n=1 Tax=Ambispora gerdemannii TaxID=144530 RepID=A0A9N8WHM9_9GLOM|nr:4257_t:CDS:2 [Ambispora gerdemannii]
MVLRLAFENFQQIFEEISREKTLLSCLLVCRSWCQIAAPILWRRPLERSPTYKIIPVYLSCLSNTQINYLLENGVDMEYTRPTPVFNYLSFARHIDNANLEISALQWCAPHDSAIDRLKILKHQFIDFTQEQRRHALLIVQELLKGFLSQCGTLRSINVEVGVDVASSWRNQISFSLPDIKGNDSVLLKLNKLVLGGTFDKTNFVKRLIGKCREIKYLSIDGLESEVSKEEPVALSQLISSQNCLCHLKLTRYHGDLSLVFASLIHHVNNIQTLELIGVNFGILSNASVYALAACENLRSLILKGSFHLGEETTAPLSRAFYKLQFFSIDEYHNQIPVDFIAGFLETTNENLRYLKIHSSMNDNNPFPKERILDTIIRCCPNLEYLELFQLNDQEITSILLSCNHLIDFIFGAEHGFEANAFLEKLGLLLPPTLRYLKVDRYYGEWDCNYQALEYFLKIVHARLECFELPNIYDYFQDESEDPEDYVFVRPAVHLPRLRGPARRAARRLGIPAARIVPPVHPPHAPLIADQETEEEDLSVDQSKKRQLNTAGLVSYYGLLPEYPVYRDQELLSKYLNDF